MGLKLYMKLFDGRQLLTKSIKIPHSLPTNETDTDLVIQSSRLLANKTQNLFLHSLCCC